jgi:CheY-like chemotaxis protein
MISGVNYGLILLVEDDENDAFFFERAFRKTAFGNRIHVAHDGLEAIQYLGGEGEYGDRSRFPLPIFVVLDLNTPRRHGIEVLRWIRTHAELRRMVVVVLTSSSSDVDLEATYDLGVNSYLLKPAEPERFLEMVQAMAGYWVGLNRAPERRAPSAPRHA